VTNLTRVESWSFFTPPSADVDPDYTFVGNRAHLGVDVRGRSLDLSGGFAYVRLENLPENAIGPGALGSGAFYFASAGLPYSYQVFLSELALTVHTLDRRVALTVGRTRFLSDGEGEAEGSARTHLSAVRRDRMRGRLVGPFDWSFYQRRMDGARFDVQGERWYGGAAWFMPTQGGFEESANLTMTGLQVASAAIGRRHGARAGAGSVADAREVQAFAHVYRDRRDVEVRPDNTGAPAEAVDVTVAAVGGSSAGTRPAGAGQIDWVLWGAAQRGDWYGQPHRAASGAVEAGYRWPSVRWRPWLRAGLSVSSGDGDRADDRHGTFFPLLTETQTYAQSFVYAQMNLRDAFVQAMVEPHQRIRVRLDVHRLDLANRADRWYYGSGATARDGLFFGFSGRASNSSTGLGTIVETTARVAITRYWTVGGYVGRMWGGPVVRGVFTGDRLFLWSVENVLRLGLTTGG
jgi:hypothetical protein